MPYQYRYVYFAHHKAVPEKHEAKWIKIGYTQNLKQRMSCLSCALIVAVRCNWDFAPTLERGIHDEFRGLRDPGSEWFRASGDLHMLIDGVLKLGYWPWDRSEVIRGQRY